MHSSFSEYYTFFLNMIHFLWPYSSRCPISVLLRPHNIPNPLSLYKTKKNPLILELARRADGPAHLSHFLRPEPPQTGPSQHEDASALTAPHAQPALANGPQRRPSERAPPTGAGRSTSLTPNPPPRAQLPVEHPPPPNPLFQSA